MLSIGAVWNFISYDPEDPEKVIIPQKLHELLKYDILWGLFVGVQLGLVIKYGRKKNDKRVDE